MTPDYIAFHAAERPNAVALIRNGSALTYARFNDDVRRFTAVLRGCRLAQGRTVLVQCTDVYCHWLLLLAAERLGLVTASVNHGAGPDALPLLQTADFVFSEQPLPEGIAKPRQSVTKSWLESVVALPAPAEEPLPLVGPDEPMRITRTSGTSGTPKRLAFSRRVFAARIEQRGCLFEFTRSARFLLDLPFTVASAQAFASACIRAGGTVVIEGRMRLWQALSAHAITHLLVLPLTLSQMVAELPPAFVKPGGLRIMTIGAQVSPTLRHKVMARLAAELCDLYATNEVGPIASDAAGSAAHRIVHPGAEVEIVDEHDRVLPLGHLGSLRVRSNQMVTGYIDDAEATARVFRDGWFYPGDTGILHAGRRLELVGRSDALLNVGGLKFAPEPLEAVARRAARSDEEVAVSSLLNANGIEELCIAVAGPPEPDRDDRLAAAFRGASLGPVRVVGVDAIPRTETGKVRRAALRACIARLANRT